MIKRILLTGASGFVGRALVPALLARGFQLRLPLRNGAAFPDLPAGSERVAIADLDTADWPAMMDGIDAVVHLAAIAHIGPSVSDDAY
jgi:UDP-glucose 4-epimerase